jgi:tetratricopeptide (TPR) repeat protein
MKFTCATGYLFFRIPVLLASMAMVSAHADEYAEVNQLVRAGKATEALSRADQFLATQPKDPQMRFIKGVIQRDSGRTAEATATFTKLTEDFPELPEPYNNLAVLYAAQSQYDKARAALEAAIRTHPSYATAHENLGDVYAKLASQAYNKALQLDASNAGVPAKLELLRGIFGKGERVPTASAATSSPQTLTTAAKPVTGAPPAGASAPVAALPNSNPPGPVKAREKVATTETKEVQLAVEQWAAAWSARDMKAYLGAYAKDFEPAGSMSRKAWEEERRQRILGKASIQVNVDKLEVTVDGNRAVAKFRQEYKAGELDVSSRKTLDFVKIAEHWLILKESVGH